MITYVTRIETNSVLNRDKGNNETQQSMSLSISLRFTGTVLYVCDIGELIVYSIMPKVYIL